MSDDPSMAYPLPAVTRGDPVVPDRPLTPRTRLAFELLAGSAVLGVLGYQLLSAAPWGVSLPLWVGALAVAIATLAGRNRVALRRAGWAWLGIAVFFSATAAWRASGALLFLGVIASLGALALAADSFRTRRSGGGVLEYLDRGCGTILRGALAAPSLALRDTRWQEISSTRRGRAAAVVRGAVLALPLLLLFGSLFANADPVFARGVEAVFRGSLEGLVPGVLQSLFWGCVAAGVLRQSLWRTEGASRLSRWIAEGAPAATRGLGLGHLEVTVVLGLLNALFAAFVLVQFRYLFGGVELVERTVGLTYAEYARRGFFELVGVAALLLPVLLALHALADTADRSEPRTPDRLRLLSRTLIALVFVILLSAAERMSLYTAEFGLTELRFYTSAFMAWLTVVLVWFAATVLRGRRERFMGGALATALVTLAALNLANPDARIAAHNLSRSADRAPDLQYVLGLSDDAVPTIVAALPRLGARQRCMVLENLEGRRHLARDGAWRDWNLGRSRARSGLAQVRREATGLDCPVAGRRY